MTRKKLIKWAKSFDKDESWVDENFIVTDNYIICLDDLDLSNTQIKSLPDNLSVGDFLDISGTPIKTLPDNLSVGGSLYISIRTNSI